MGDLRFQCNGTEIILEAAACEGGWRIRLPDGSMHQVIIEREPGDVLRIVASAPTSTGSAYHIFRVPFLQTSGSTSFAWKGSVYNAAPIEASRRTAGSSSSGVVSAPVGGIVVDVMVKEGDEVSEGDPIAVIEAMKVMTTVEAVRSGCIAKLHVVRAQRIEQGATVAEIARASEQERQEGAE